MPSLIEQVADYDNLKKALAGLNQKSYPGYDHVSIQKLHKILPRMADELGEAIINGTYEPGELLRVHIPKKKNEADMRMLGIPCTRDRMIQASIVQVIAPMIENSFSEYSYGFIEGRGCFPALLHVLELVNAGKSKVVNIDLKKFFDNVPHDTLMEILNNYIDDEKLLLLIYRYLKAVAFERRRGFVKIEKGVPQGGPLSPLLSNIVLNELDAYLEANHISFSRYADDCIILCGGEREAEYVFNHITDFIENVLHLEINYKKSFLADITEIEYLGYGFQLLSNGRYAFDVKPERFEDLQNRVYKIIQNYYRKVPNKEFIQRVMWITRGWVNYYAMADIREQLQEFDQWFCDSIIEIHEKELMEYKRERQELVKMGVSFRRACNYAGISNVMANGQVINPTIAPERYYRRIILDGYILIEELYDIIRKKWRCKRQRKDKIYDKNKGK